MLQAITTKKGIEAAERLLLKRMSSVLPRRTGSYTLGFQSGNITVDDLLADHRFWFNAPKEYQESNNRYWNAFGIAEYLNLKKSNNIVVEINVLKKGYARKVAGLFAKDDNDNIYLLHTGKIGGGRKGVGKSAFLQWLNKDLVDFQVGENIHGQAILVAHLQSDNFSNQIANFVRAVAQFKESSQVDQIIELNNDDLLEKIKKQKKTPSKNNVESVVFIRNPLVNEYVKRRAAGKCDLCNKEAPFVDKNKRPFLECHHIEWLSDGGSDSIDNAVALCPNCHRKMHILSKVEHVNILKNKAKRTINNA